MKKHFIIILFSLLGLDVHAQTTWYEVDVATSKQLNVIEWATPSVGYIGGNDSLLLKTVDGGQNWTEVNYSGVTFYPSGEHIVNLDFVSAEIGYMSIGPYYGVYKTTDGGINWTDLSEASMCFTTGLYFTSDGNGFVGGSGCFMGEMIRRFQDGTPTFSTVNFPGIMATDMIVDIDFEGTLGLAASASGRIYRSTDGGDSWDSIPSSMGSMALTSVEIINDTLAYAGFEDEGSAMGILWSTDAGASWSSDFSSATFFYPSYLCLNHAPGGRIYSGGKTPFGPPHGVILETELGSTWLAISVDQAIRSMDSPNDNVTWGVGDSGYVVVNVPPTNLGTEKAKTSSQFNCYPVPTDDVLFFDRDLEKVEVLDITGKVVMEAERTNSINMSGLRKGSYFIRSGGTSKRVLLK